MSFIVSLLIAFQWNTSSREYDLNRLPYATNIKEINHLKKYGSIAGTVILNLAISYVIPSWIKLKQRGVNVQKTVWISQLIITMVFVITGVIMALGYDQISESGVLPLLSARGTPNLLSKITVNLFAFIMLLPSIPVNMIISRDNLTQNKVVSTAVANFLSFAMPILVMIPIQNYDNLSWFQPLTSFLFVCPANFIIPVLIYFKSIYFRRAYNEDRSKLSNLNIVLSSKQIQLLHAIHFRSGTIVNFLNMKNESIVSEDNVHQSQGQIFETTVNEISDVKNDEPCNLN